MSKRAYLFGLCILAVAILFAVPAWADTVTLVTSQAALAPNDFTTWGQLGADGTVVPNGSTATSAGGNTVTVNFAGGMSGLTAVQCPANPSCSWVGGFNAGDALVWANNGSAGTGPLDLSLSNTVSGAGLALQSDAPAQFTALVQVTFTGGSTSSIFSVVSDLASDPVFIGLVDNSGANIDGISFDIINSGSDHDFASDTLDTVNPTTAPEPGTLLLLGSGLIGIGLRRKKLGGRLAG